MTTPLYPGESPEAAACRIITSRKTFLSPQWRDLMRLNAVYYDGKDVETGITPMHLDYEHINEVLYGFCRALPDGSILLGNEYVDCHMDIQTTKGCIGALLSMKKTYEHLRVLFSIAGPETNTSMPIIAADPMLRARFCSEALSLLDNAGFDGIDIIWEYPESPIDAANFIILLEYLSETFRAQNYILTVKLPASPHALRHLDLTRLGNAIDMLNLTCYDLLSADGRSMHPAQLNVPATASSIGLQQPCVMEGIVNIMNRGFPTAKIMMGIPVFGRAFQNCSGMGQAYESIDMIKYRDLPYMGTKEQVDGLAVATTSGMGWGWLVSHDNPVTVTLKGRTAKQLGLAGLFYWMGPWDSPDIRRSLVVNGHRSMHLRDDSG